MVKNCSAFGCLNRIHKCRQGVHFHRLPADERLRRKWMVACGRPDWSPGKHTYICSEHFEEGCYTSEHEHTGTTTKAVKVRLRPNAYPTVFGELPPSVGQHATCHTVEFKPEMWEDEKQPPAPVKKPRGRPRKNITKSCHLNGNTIKSEVVSCCALACTNTSETHVMNCLPRDTAMHQTWVEKIDRLDWTPDEDSALCEIHFEPEMWDHDMGEEKILKLDAIPTLNLHGESIKSWVTMDNSGNVENVVVGCSQNDEKEEHESDVEEEDPEIIVKGEDLEPEIDMVEGIDELSQDSGPTEKGFETIYCDSTFNEQAEETEEVQIKRELSGKINTTSHVELENPLDPDSDYHMDDSDVECFTPIQDEEIMCMTDSLNKPNNNTPQATGNVSNFVVISKPRFRKEKIRRRNSSQLSDDFKCPICERRLSRRKNLEIHIQKLHPNGDHYDTLTPSESSRKANLMVTSRQEMSAREADLVFTMLLKMQSQKADECVLVRQESFMESLMNCTHRARSRLMHDSESVVSLSSDSDSSDPQCTLPDLLKVTKKRREEKTLCSKMTPEDKRIRRNELNKIASYKYYLKKRQNLEELLKEEKQLKHKNDHLKSEMQELDQKIKYLNNLLCDMFKQGRQTNPKVIESIPAYQ